MTTLNDAKFGKKDEFYTDIKDIEKELSAYRKEFKNKVVLCNCDDPNWSNFWRFFEANFDHFGLKGLISTHYAETTLFENEPSYKLEITRTPTGKMSKAKKTMLKGDGDFRSDECVALLKEADIVVTNPPFSLFREYVAQLVKFKKKYLILGNMNAVTCKDIFPLFQENKMWYGHSISSGDREFRVPDDYPLNASGCRVNAKGEKFIRVKGIRWFTNMDHKKRHEELVLVKKYRKAEYPKYDNFDAINVNATKDIPVDHKGLMGVPITFLDKYNPDQFEIIGMDRYVAGNKTPNKRFLIDGEEMYARIVIRNKQF